VLQCNCDEIDPDRLVFGIGRQPAFRCGECAACYAGPAKAMLDKAVIYYKANGREKALADFTRKRPPFADRDLYVFCIGPITSGREWWIS